MALPSLQSQVHPEPDPRAPVHGRRSLLKLAGLAALTLAVAACGGRQRPVQVPPPEREPEPEQVRQPGRLPADETRNRVAVLVPLSGVNAQLGRSILNAANLALFDTGGERIRITAYDTSSGAAAAANEALADGNGLILGPLLAEDVRAVAPVARRAEVPVIAFSNDVSVAGNGVFIMGFNPGQSIDRVVAFARSRDAQRFAGLAPTSVYGERSGEALRQSVEAASRQLVGIETYGAAADIRNAATSLHGRGRLDAVLIADSPAVAALAAPILRQASPQPRLLGTELWATDANIGSQSALRGAWFAAPSDANFAPFRTRYRARYNVNPYRLGTLGYDAVLLAVRIAANWPVGRRFPARALTDPTGFSGVDGAFRFSRDGVAERALEVREIGAGTTTVVSPAPRGFN
jgi:ABC-type branched-subunit amino acid transport system substrate-binding protein